MKLFLRSLFFLSNGGTRIGFVSFPPSKSHWRLATRKSHFAGNPRAQGPLIRKDVPFQERHVSEAGKATDGIRNRGLSGKPKEHANHSLQTSSNASWWG